MSLGVTRQSDYYGLSVPASSVPREDSEAVRQMASRPGPRITAGLLATNLESCSGCGETGDWDNYGTGVDPHYLCPGCADMTTYLDEK